MIKDFASHMASLPNQIGLAKMFNESFSDKDDTSENPFAVIEAPEGCAECFWCGGFKDIKTMAKDKRHGVTIYICKVCQ